MVRIQQPVVAPRATWLPKNIPKKILLKQIFSKAEEWNFIMTNPASKVKKFTEPKRIPRFISPDEEDLLMQNSTKWLQMFIIIGLGTGMRSGEILNLQLENIDLFRKLVYVKSDKEGGFMTKTRSTG